MAYQKLSLITGHPESYKSLIHHEKRRNKLSLIECGSVEEFDDHSTGTALPQNSQSLGFFIEAMRKKNTPSSQSETLPSLDCDHEPSEKAEEVLAASKKTKFPMTCTHNHVRNTFSKPTFSPQNLNSMLFNSSHQSDSRKIFMAKLLKEKLGPERFEELQSLCESSSIDQVINSLPLNEQPLASMIRGAFSGPSHVKSE